MLKNIKAELAICVFAFLLLIYKIDVLPGFHGDESWVLLRVFQEISKGRFSWSGMNYYTGSLHAMLVAPFVLLFGYSVTVSRVLAVFLNVFALLFLMKTVRITTKSKYLSHCVGLWTATLPVFLLDSRIAVEILALNPLLLSLGCYFLSQAFFINRNQTVNSIASGFFFALASFSHGSSLYIPIGISFAALVVFRKAAVFNKLAWISGLSFSTVFLFLSIMRGWGNHVDSVYSKYV